MVSLFQLSQIVYFGRAIPFVILDSMPSMRKYKIQEVSSTIYRRGVASLLTTLFSAGPSGHSRATMEVHQVRATIAFHSRVTSDMVIPPNLRILSHVDTFGTFPCLDQDGLADWSLLLIRRYVPLLGP